MDDSSHRPVYSKAQIEKYLDHISLPQKNKEEAFSISQSSSQDAQLEFLTSLQRHQLCAIPFENLSIHYSPHHTVSLDPEYLYKKIIDDDRGRGGYCMENNCFFGTVLRTLGFDLYSVGGRVADAVNGSPGGGYQPWSHMINLIHLGPSTYMLDVGFGSDGPTRPLPLSHQTISTGIGSQQLRLIHETIAPSTNKSPSQKMWILQRRHSPDDDWLPAYAFTEIEFLPRDYGMMNYYTSTSRTCFFTYAVVAVKMIKGDGEEVEEVVGQMILTNGEVKRRIKGETQHLATCKSEAERVDALEKWFGLRLTREERRGIEGLVTELKN